MKLWKELISRLFIVSAFTRYTDAIITSFVDTWLWLWCIFINILTEIKAHLFCCVFF